MKTPTTNQEAVDIAIDYLHEEMRLWKDDHDRGDNAEVRELFVVGKAVAMSTPLFQASPDLLEACQAALEWAKTPGPHGGNPYCHEFIKLAEAAIAKAQPTSAD